MYVWSTIFICMDYIGFFFSTTLLFKIIFVIFVGTFFCLSPGKKIDYH